MKGVNMGAVKWLVMDIEEELEDVVCENEVVDEAVIKKIAEKVGCGEHMVKGVYEDWKKENYEW
jgi:hypothetical protein